MMADTRWGPSFEQAQLEWKKTLLLREQRPWASEIEVIEALTLARYIGYHALDSMFTVGVGFVQDSYAADQPYGATDL